jgi:hypothetical protein
MSFDMGLKCQIKKKNYHLTMLLCCSSYRLIINNKFRLMTLYVYCINNCTNKPQIQTIQVKQKTGNAIYRLTINQKIHTIQIKKNRKSHLSVNNKLQIQTKQIKKTGKCRFHSSLEIHSFQFLHSTESLVCPLLY